MERSSHVAIRVPKDQVRQAVEHYKATLGVVEKSEKDGCIELAGANFTLWVDPAENEAMVLQEFITDNGPSTRSRLAAAGCQVFDESPEGFHVRDPFGLCYHVCVE